MRGFPDGVATYLRDVSRHPMLGRRQQDLLARRAARGDDEASRKLVCSHLRLVVKIALEYRGYGLDVLDLIQQGNIGLVNAVSRFDPTRKVTLASYAATWIRAMILRYVQDNLHLVKFATTTQRRRLFFRLRGAEEELRRLGVPAVAEALAKHLMASEADVNDVGRALHAPDVSLDAPVRGDAPGATRTGADLLADAAPGPDQQVEEEEIRQIVGREIAAFERTLDARSRVFFAERWLNDDPPSLGELGRRFGISRERARQIEARTLARLRARLMPVLQMA